MNETLLVLCSGWLFRSGVAGFMDGYPRAACINIIFGAVMLTIAVSA